MHWVYQMCEDMGDISIVELAKLIPIPRSTLNYYAVNGKPLSELPGTYLKRFALFFNTGSIDRLLLRYGG